MIDALLVLRRIYAIDWRARSNPVYKRCAALYARSVVSADWILAGINVNSTSPIAFANGACLSVAETAPPSPNLDESCLRLQAC
jgi:hypothetical protein